MSLLHSLHVIFWIKIAELKSKIAAEKSKEKDTIKLVHKGKQLNDDTKTVAEIGIKENDFVILMIFLKVRKSKEMYWEHFLT